jgi:hypothetical protein
MQFVFKSTASSLTKNFELRQSMMRANQLMISADDEN